MCCTLVAVAAVVGGLMDYCFLSCEIIVCNVQEQNQESAYAKLDQSITSRVSISERISNKEHTQTIQTN